ncbi:acyl-CoA carboxylase subunit epsilon [Janibacter hoylei]|uniref:acyl-CoA carboxylase subunit epsilon n=1 Tax=Janibacter hoylei TaxID=364298 RepID=UPI0021A75D3E|nr:acyl-CoA carboxylase subunit epsilon [Janibacter hoylei]MCT2292459.1 acyl-CoA carboxylase subunit epsilon [Janibacter hoylei]MCW4601051.1 acyl-CoA carboxylase subunit epsilon [Janibacter hoylei]
MASQAQPETAAPEAVVPAGPRIEVLGDASPEQVAALVAVLSGLGGGEEEAPAGPPSRWSSPERLVRRPVHPSLGGWAASGLPR